MSGNYYDPQKPGEGVTLPKWPLSVNNPRGKGSKKHCPACANCSDSAAARRGKQSAGHVLCLKHREA